MAESYFALVDCNNFYVSCERIFNPRLNGRPVLVLSNNDGCVIARSNEVKAMGVKMGVPFYQVKDLVEREHIVVYSPNFALYGDISHRVMTVLGLFTSDMEVYSVDEAFLKLSDFHQADMQARIIRKTLLQWIKVPVSIGVAQTKTLAKVANHIAKKHLKTGGVVVLDTPQLIEGALKRTPVGEVWGVGRKLTTKLASQGIHTAYDLSMVNDQWLLSKYSVVLARTVYELRGTSCLALDTVLPPKKSIMTSRSFGRQVTELRDLQQAISGYTARGAEKLRQEGLAAKGLCVFIETNRFRSWEPQYSQSATVTMPVATQYTHELIHYARQGLNQVFKHGYGYHKAGVMMLGLAPANEIQTSLLDGQNRETSDRLMQVLDGVNLEHGAGSLRYAAEGMGKRWNMRQEHRSKRFTTHWNELPEVKA